MSFSLLDLWRRATGVFTQPVPKPIPPVVAPGPVLEPTVGTIYERDEGTRIKVEFQYAPGKWRDVGDKLIGSEPLAASKADGRLWRKLRITVLQGELTGIKLSKSGKNNPKISTPTPLHTVYAKGGVFYVQCSVGPLTVSKKSGWDQANFGVHTKELGQIVQLSAQVMYGE